MNLNIADYAVWIASMFLEALLLALVIWRKHPYPAFKAYLAWQLVSNLALYYICSAFDIWTYAIAYMTVFIAGTAFTTAVAAEVFAHVFRPYRGVPRAFLWATIAFIALIAGCANRICVAGVSYLKATEHGIQFAGVAGFALTLILSSYLFAPRRKHVFGIVIGFLIYISAQGITEYLALPRITGTGAFIFAELIWGAYMVQPQPALVETSEDDLVLARKAVKTLESVQCVVSKRLGMELSFR